jgi:hypothetical protein
MTTIAIMPENPEAEETSYRAVSGKKQSVGRTPGEALDALTAQLGEEETGTLLVVQNLRPDHFFTAPQQQRLAELMARWRIARDTQTALSSAEQAELEELAKAEVQAATQRAAALVRELAP